MNKIPNQNSLLWKYQNPVIVYCHMVSEQIHPYYPYDSINPIEFREHIKNLKKIFNIISLPEAIERHKLNNHIKNSLILTIDDGFTECYSVIAPILEEERIPATFFLINNCIDNKNMMWIHKLEYLNQSLPKGKKHTIIKQFFNQTGKSNNSETGFMELSKQWSTTEKDNYADIIWNLSLNESIEEWLQKHQPYLTIQQIKELVNAEFNIGSHSSTHPSCDKLNLDELKNEILESSNSIGEKLGTKIKYFSYPFGRRASKNYEDKILKNSNIKCLIGGKPRLLRKNPFPFWEAYNFERKYSNLLYHLFVNSFSIK